MKKNNKKKLLKDKTSAIHEIIDYDKSDTVSFIDKNKRLSIASMGVELPKESPSQVVSIRLPTWMLNKLRSISSQRDIPYQSLIKILLSES